MEVAVRETFFINKIQNLIALLTRIKKNKIEMARMHPYTQNFLIERIEERIYVAKRKLICLRESIKNNKKKSFALGQLFLDKTRIFSKCLFRKSWQNNKTLPKKKSGE